MIKKFNKLSVEFYHFNSYLHLMNQDLENYLFKSKPI